MLYDPDDGRRTLAAAYYFIQTWRAESPEEFAEKLLNSLLLAIAFV